MMGQSILIDSHILIWMLYEPDKISSESVKLIQDSVNVYVSVVSVWELAIKYNNKRLLYSPDEISLGIEQLNLTLLNLKIQHSINIQNINLPHNDPFDTLLISQSEIENLIFLTADKTLLSSQYNTHKC